MEGQPPLLEVPPRGLSTFKQVTLPCSQMLMATTYAFSSPSQTRVDLTCVYQIKNISPTEPLIFLEVFNADRFVDFSATQWRVFTIHNFDDELTPASV